MLKIRCFLFSIAVVLSGCGGGGGGGDPSPTASSHLFLGANFGASPLLYEYSISQSDSSLTNVLGSPFTPVGFPQLLRSSPTSRTLYSVQPPSRVEVYDVNATSGSLTQVPFSPYTSTISISDLTVSPNGKFLYLVGGVGTSGTNSGGVIGMSIDPSNHALTSIPGASRTLPAVGIKALISKDSKFLYIICSDSASATPYGIVVYAIDQSTGALTYSSGITTPATQGNLLNTVYLSPSGNYLYFGDGYSPGHIYITSINTVTGVAAGIGNYLTTGAVRGIEISSGSDKMFVLADTSTILNLAISPSGALTYVGSTIAPGSGVNSIALDPSGGHLYFTTGNSISAYSVNPSNGNLSSVSSSPVSIGGATWASNISIVQ